MARRLLRSATSTALAWSVKETMHTAPVPHHTLTAHLTWGRCLPAHTLGRRTVTASAQRCAGGNLDGNDVDPMAAALKARRLALPLGVAAGVFGSWVGVGGGLVIVPTLAAVCSSIPQRVLSGTSLVAVCSTALASVGTYASAGLVDAPVAAIVATGAVVAAPLGALLTTRLRGSTLRRVLGVFLLCAAASVPFKAWAISQAPMDMVPPCRSLAAFLQSPVEALAQVPPGAAALKAGIGLVAGLSSGLLGIGGGMIVTPMLALCTAMPQAAVLGTSLLCMVPPSLAALAQHWRLNNVDPRLGAALAAGTLIGGALGSRVAVHIPNEVLQVVLSLGMLFLGIRTLRTAR